MSHTGKQVGKTVGPKRGLEYDGFIVYVHFLNLGNLELEYWEQ